MDIVRQLVEQRPDFFANKPAGDGGAKPINDFIFASPGLSYSYLIKTKAGRIVVNTGMGFEGPVHKRAYDAIAAGPTPYIILTQGHVDHVGGVHLFREPGTKLIAQRNNSACQADDARIRTVRGRQSAIWFGAQIEATIKLMRENPQSIIQDEPVPDITFDDRYDLDCGGMKLELLSVPGGETIDSLAIWLPEHKICFTGNMFGPLFPHFPNFNTIRGDRYRYFEPYLKSVARIRALEPEMLITGRYDPIVGKDLIRACLDRLEAAVSYVHRTTLDGMNAGKDIFTLMREIQLPDNLFVGQGYGKVSWGVRTIWEAYMGWFKADHTSELYPTRPSAIYADLVNAAGRDAILALGRKALDANDPEKANLFCEALLTATPNDKDVITLAIHAHEALIERSNASNFWETGWLRDRVVKLKASL